MFPPDNNSIDGENVRKNILFQLAHTSYRYPLTIDIKGGDDVIVDCSRCELDFLVVNPSIYPLLLDKEEIVLTNRCIFEGFIRETPPNSCLNLSLVGEIKSVKDEKIKHAELKTKYDGLNIIYFIFGISIGFLLLLAYVIKKEIKDPTNILIGIIVGAIFTLYAQGYMELYTVYNEGLLLFLKPFVFCLGGILLGGLIGYLLYFAYDRLRK